MTDATAETITVAGVRTLVRRTGTGPPVLVVHGGPGFDHRYIEPTLSSLADRRTLIFYDQPAATESGVEVTADQIFRHCAAFLNEVVGDGSAGLIAHSWGVLVALGAAAAGIGRTIFDEGLLVCPVPIDRGRYDDATRNLFARFPREVAERYQVLAAEGDQEQIVKLLLPYYLAKPNSATGIDLHLNIRTFLSVSQSLGAFHFARELPLVGRCATLLAGRDFTTPELVEELLSATAERYDIADAGHFPGHETPVAFESILAAVFPR